ncbi:hypothetical protein FVR03_00425 [Pontibacter qinzhouensis]|uniref:Lipoprotein n=1 Tax=Pontibacter qinzhouensis TaxID=2603253 RepID=A0A5C8KD65_9BACT|nr:hypothetical protein [Pontibacter qinzhouensis]TXK52874.1 hypothetical protein FVR03_00425 [Pontibacter qinzhouensis]
MNKNNLFLVLAAFAAMATASCSKKPFDVERVEVAQGQTFSICLDQALPPERQYFYSIQFVTKDSLRYTTVGPLTADSTATDNCFTETKFRYSMSAYADETISAIENISNQNLDTCRVQIYTDRQLEQGKMVLEKVFTAEDFK